MPRNAKLRRRAIATTILEIAGAVLIVAGIYLLAGPGWAAVAAGAGCIGVSYLVISR